MKLCKDCKYFPKPSLASLYPGYPICQHPDQPHNPVYGHADLACDTARGRNTLPPWNTCGPDGSLFEQAPEPEPIVEQPLVAYGLPEEEKPVSLVKQIFGRRK